MRVGCITSNNDEVVDFYTCGSHVAEDVDAEEFNRVQRGGSKMEVRFGDR